MSGAPRGKAMAAWGTSDAAPHSAVRTSGCWTGSVTDPARRVPRESRRLVQGNHGSHRPASAILQRAQPTVLLQPTREADRRRRHHRGLAKPLDHDSSPVSPPSSRHRDACRRDGRDVSTIRVRSDLTHRDRSGHLASDGAPRARSRRRRPQAGARGVTRLPADTIVDPEAEGECDRVLRGVASVLPSAGPELVRR